MKYSDPSINVPWINTKEDGTTERCWSSLSFAGAVDRRRIRREVRKWVKRALGRTLYTEELHMLTNRKRINTDAKNKDLGHSACKAGDPS